MTALPIAYFAGQLDPGPSTGMTTVPGVPAPAGMRAVTTIDPTGFTEGFPWLGIVLAFPSSWAPKGWAVCNGSTALISSSGAQNQGYQNVPYYNGLYPIIGAGFGPSDTITYSLPTYSPGPGLVGWICVSGQFPTTS